MALHRSPYLFHILSLRFPVGVAVAANEISQLCCQVSGGVQSRSVKETGHYAHSHYRKDIPFEFSAIQCT
jgi:hypothetical protein